MTAAARHHLFAGLLPGCFATLVLVSTPTLGQSAGDTKAFENKQYNFSVALSVDCRHEEGPGTLDAFCSPDMEHDGSRAVSTRLSALSLQISAETVASDAGKTPSALAQQYTEAMFKAELPEAVCGESDSTRAMVQNVNPSNDETSVVYTADVVCAGVRFLQLRQRTASVRYVIAPTGRYRLIARAASEEFEKQKARIEAFFASFAVTPATR